MRRREVQLLRGVREWSADGAQVDEWEDEERYIDVGEPVA